MHIKELIIDGFKSYPNRTVVSGFDPAFNAITGLNGSGKSNILDSICFVLGITNLSQVRCGSLSELVYKQGQAGVTKASVTIIFDNKDEKTSPVGYEQHSEISVCRQIVINGKNKYMINGHTAQQEQVKNLFHSVQLNVNNPHFLIMQGRITKVLNMNPMEILSMIEEAAGTRMFETKKQAAIKTMERKQQKNDEIDRVLTEEITPTLEKLRMEKGNYLTYMANETKIERSERFCIAFEYKEATDTLAASQSELEEMGAELTGHLDHAVVMASEMKAKDEELKALSSRRGGDVSKAFGKAKEVEDHLSKELVRLSTMWKNKEEAMTKDEAALKAAKIANEQGGKAVEAKEKSIAVVAEEHKKATDVVQAKTSELAEAERAYQNMCAGVSSTGASEEEAGTLTDQVSNAKKAAAVADEQVKQGQMTAKHLSESVKGLRKDLKAAAKETESMSAELKASEAAMAKMEGKLSGVSFDPKEQQALDNEKKALEGKVAHLKQVSERIEAELAGRLAFEYKSPFKGFDRSKVKGLVARLVAVKDSKYATALEVVAGGKLYQVVVDDTDTAKALLQKGQLRRRVTIIPLSKISRNGLIDPGRGAAAGAIAAGRGGSAVRAIELVGYDQDVRAAMEYAFGDKIVCDSLDTARKVAHDPKVHKKCVTLDGDVVDPSGTMTGGSSQGIGSSLAKLTQLSDATKELAASAERLGQVASSLKALEKGAAQHATVAEALDLKKEEVALLKERLSHTTAAALETKLEVAEGQLAEAEAKAASAKEAGVVARKKAASLEGQAVSLRKAREERLKDMEKGVKVAKKELKDAETKASAVEKKLKLLGMELSKLVDEVSSGQGSVAALEEEIEATRVSVAACQDGAKAKRREYDQAKAALDECGEQLASIDAEAKELGKEKEKCGKALSNAQLEAKKMEGRLKTFNKDQATAKEFVARMQAKYAWITGEAKYFGVQHTDYDFEARNPKSAQQDLKELQKQQEGLSKMINKKVMNMLDKAESEYVDLISKRNVVESDRAKIEKVIGELEVKKNQALQTTWIKVNRDFGSIFSTLLPGATAKLEPPEASMGSVLAGLEVKVAFGKVWKNSLTELSGGQRSLLALSLILALLLFKPAPMYILDEVDAALDLSHTQNIGAMLRTHFSNSQFIVVSLKEGMFNNANVIFTTKFVDGSSTVSRTANGSAVALLKAKDKARQQQTASSSSSSSFVAVDENAAGSGENGRKGPQKKRGKGAAAAVGDEDEVNRAGVY